MLYALSIALVAIVIVDRWLLDRKDKRHAAQVDRLLLWRHDPHTATLPDATGSVLYLAPEDDHAWNEAHGKTPAN